MKEKKEDRSVVAVLILIGSIIALFVLGKFQ